MEVEVEVYVSVDESCDRGVVAAVEAASEGFAADLGGLPDRDVEEFGVAVVERPDDHRNSRFTRHSCWFTKQSSQATKQRTSPSTAAASQIATTARFGGLQKSQRIKSKSLYLKSNGQINAMVAPLNVLRILLVDGLFLRVLGGQLRRSTVHKNRICKPMP